MWLSIYFEELAHHEKKENKRLRDQNPASPGTETEYIGSDQEEYLFEDPDEMTRIHQED